MSSVAASNPYESLGLSLPAASLGRGGDTQLGQEDFLKLITTQMQNQDPTKPVDNAEFISQMAQFSSMNSIQSMEQTFKGMADKLLSGQALQASSLVGRNVLVPSEYGVLSTDSTLVGAVDLPSHARQVSIEVLTPAGQQLKTFSLGEQDAGRVFFQWDGKSAQGDQLPPGVYQVRAQYYNGTSTEALDVLSNTVVDSVTLESSGSKVNTIGLGSYGLDSVKEIR